MAFDDRWLLTLGLTVWVIALSGLRRRLAPAGDGRAPFAVIGLLLAAGMVWLPPDWATALLALCLFGFAAVSGGFFAGVVFAILGAAASWLTPGGAPTAMCGFVGLSLGLVAFSIAGRMRMRARTDRLRPGTPCEDPVLLEAGIDPSERQMHPVTGAPVAAWRILVDDEVVAAEPARLRLHGAAGTMLVELAACELEADSQDDGVVLRPDALAALPTAPGEDASVRVQALPVEATVTVMGRCTWAPDPDGGSYRGAPDVPVFANVEDDAPFLAARSLEDQRRVDRANVVELGGWVLAFGAVAAAPWLR